MLISLAEVLVAVAADKIGEVLAEHLPVSLPITIRLKVEPRPSYTLASHADLDESRCDARWLL